MEKFFAAVRNMFNVPDLRRRIFFTLGLLAVYRFGAHVGTPGINKPRLDEVFNAWSFVWIEIERQRHLLGGPRNMRLYLDAKGLRGFECIHDM